MTAKRIWILVVPLSRMIHTVVLLILLVGLPIRGDSTSSTSNSKAPTARECRKHVEKALDQYFDSKDEGDHARKRVGNPPTTLPPASDYDDESDDDDDDDDPPLNVSEKSETVKQDSDEEDDDDDDEEDDEDDDDEENEDDEGDKSIETKTNRPTTSINKTAADDDEDDEDDDDDEEEKNHEDKKNASVLPNITSQVNVGKQNVQNVKTPDTAKMVQQKYNDGDDDDDEEADSKEDYKASEKRATAKENLNKYILAKKTVSNTSRNGALPNKAIPQGNTKGKTVEVKKNVIEDDDDDDENDDDDDDDDDEDEEEAEKTKKRPEPVRKFNIPMPTFAASKPILPTPSLKTTTGAKTTESEKVAGATSSAGSRVAQKLPGLQPQAEQSKTQKSEKTQETLIKPAAEGIKKAQAKTSKKDDDVKNKEDDDDDDGIENIYEDEEDDDETPGRRFRNRDHIEAILNMDEIDTDYEQEEDKLAQSIFREIKKIHATSIRPMEMLYKYTDSTTRLLGDAEIFNKPMILFLGPWSTGKTTIINYLLGIERTPAALKTGTGITDVDFTVITHGEQKQTTSGTELAANWRYASVQKFGQGFLDHFKSITMPHTLLKKVSLVDTPGILESRKNIERGYPFNDAFQWFIDRADSVYVVLDPTKVDIGAELGAVLDQLKGREVRFILNKADSIRRSDLMRVVGQLFWNLSPLMSGTEAPVIYAVSLSTKPFNPSAPYKFLIDQENNFLYGLKDTMDKRVENRILYARRHAVRVRNHAKMVDCYLATYYKHKSIFSSKKNVAKLIIENPSDYHIYDGLSSMSNVSRYDLPDASHYRNFFKLHPLYDFKPLASTCSYFRGCPMDKLDNAIANDLPELFTKYKKVKNNSPQPAKQQQR